MPKKHLTLYLLAAILGGNVFSQQVLNSSGNTLSNRDYIFEYSVGEITVSTIKSNSVNNPSFVTQGLLQPSIKVENPACQFINDTLQFFPNPAHDVVSISARYNWITNFIIYDAAGRLIINSPFYNNIIDVSKYAKGMYFIILFPGCSNKFKTLKILKQ